MSTEYKDWKRDKIETEKHIVSEYPFLQLRDIDGAIAPLNCLVTMCGAV